MTTTATFPPLTEQEFAAGCGYKYRGINICEDEQGNWVFAWGHREPALFAKAVNDYDREMGGFDEPGYGPTDAQHVWAVNTSAVDSTEGWWLDWSDGITEQTSNAFAVTVVSR